MKEALPPRTRATTPIAILKAVVKAIREEPLRYDQSYWLKTKQSDAYYFEPSCDSDDVSRYAASCGTMGCVAGWVVTLKRPQSQKLPRMGDTNKKSVYERARLLLKLDHGQAQTLFADSVSGTVGTKRYVENGIKKIERFMRTEMGYKGPNL